MDETTTVMVYWEIVEVTDEQYNEIQQLYQHCKSCGNYEEWTEPEHWDYICELCYD